MRTLVVAVVVLSIAALAMPGWAADEFKAGLVAHYYKDVQNWGGNWPDGVSVPKADPKDWTFTTYAYSREEPLINHLFIRNGWFSVRWVGYINVQPGEGSEKKTPDGPVSVTFELWFDDGARLTIDGQKVIDDWKACWEKAPESHRKATATPTPGMHRIVIEYFQGQSLEENDHDPAKAFWASDDLGIKHQPIPAAHFFHKAEDLNP